MAKKKDESITAYKGFDIGFVCRGFKYEIRKSYDHAGEVKACDGGFHACEYPLDVFGYYPPASSAFAIVEQKGTLSKDGGDSKVASSHIAIKAQVSFADMAKASVDFVLARVKKTKKGTNTGNQSAATNTGNRSAATNTGNRSAATNTGDQSAATNTGEHGIAAAFGLESKAMAGTKGIVIVAWYDKKKERKRVVVGYAGENGIKENTWYSADENGALVEVA